MIEALVKTHRFVEGSMQLYEMFDDVELCGVNETLQIIKTKMKPSRRVVLEDTVPDPIVEKFYDILPEMQDYAFPSRNPTRCAASLVITTDSRSANHPQPARLQSAEDFVVATFPHAAPPEFLVENELSRRDVVRTYPDLSDESNPGYPYCLQGETKRDYAVARAAEVSELVVARYVGLLNVDESKLMKASPMLIYQAGLSDPSLVIEKNEPHKKAKLERQRNIICGSLATEIQHRCLDTRLNTATKELWGECPSLIGIGFDPESISRTYDAIDLLSEECGGSELADNDARNFDASRQEWHFTMDANARARRYGFGVGSPQASLYRKTAVVSARKLFVFTDGTVMPQKSFGMMGSGEFRTSMTNSTTRVGDSHIIGSASARAAGDDCVEQWVRDAERRYKEEIGVQITDYKKASKDCFELCSMQYNPDGKVVPLRAAKAFFNLAARSFKDRDAYVQVITQFRHAPQTGPFFARVNQLRVFN